MCMQVLKEKMDVLRLTFYTAPVSVGILVPFFLATELRKLLSYGCAGFCSQSTKLSHSSCKPKPYRQVYMLMCYQISCHFCVFGRHHRPLYPDHQLSTQLHINQGVDL